MSNTPEVAVRPTRLRFIQDEPARDDFFQTHTRLASALASTIRANPRTRVVGLLGKWGSGKSTVVKHLAEALTAEPETERVHVFTYDTWLHQHDPVRRSFLENLFEYLMTNGYVEQAQWAIRFDELKGMRETSNVTSTPKFAPGGKLIVLSLLLLPVAIAVLDLDTIKEAFGSSTTPAGIATFWVCALLLLFPALLFLARWLRAGTAAEADQLLSLFMNKSTEITATKTTKDPEPSAIEFRRLFRAVMQDASKNGDRFVFVIDNLDRIEESEALQIWATIRSFFLSVEEDSLDRSKGFMPPTVVLPIDRHSLSRLFDQYNDNESEQLLGSFMDKTFDLTFEVPPPVMSDWRAYLAQQTEYALGFDAASLPVYWLRRFFEAGPHPHSEGVTPRQINKLVNRVVALAIQWADGDVSFESISFYAVYSDVFRRVGPLTLFSDPTVAVVPQGPNWQQEVAALYFGVEPIKASQLLLSRPLTAAVVSQDHVAFQQLSEVAGFYEVLEQIIEEFSKSAAGEPSDFVFITNLAILLDSSGPPLGIWLSETWRSLIELYGQSGGGNTPVPDLENRIAVFFSHVMGDEERFIAATATKVSSMLASDVSLDELKAVAKAAERLVEFGGRTGNAVEFELGMDTAAFLARLRTLDRIAPALTSKLRWPGTAADAVSELITMIDAPPRHTAVPGVVRILLAPSGPSLFLQEGKFGWDRLIEALKGVAQQSRSASAASPAALETLGLLIDFSEARAALVALVDDENVAARLGECVEAQDYAQAAKIAALLVWRGGDFAPPGKPWNEFLGAQPNFAKSTHQALAQYLRDDTLPSVWRSYEKAPNARPLVRRMIQYAIETGNLGRLDLTEVLGNARTYLAAVPQTLQERFARELTRYPKFSEQLAKVAGHDEFASIAGILSRKRSPFREQVLKLWMERVDRLPVEDWSSAIATGAQPYRLVMSYSEKAPYEARRESDLLAALQSYAIPLLTASSDQRRRWFGLAKLLNRNAERASLYSVTAALADADDVKDLTGLLDMSESALLLRGGLHKNPDVGVNKIVLPLTATKHGQAWLDRSHASVRPWVHASSSSARQALKNRLEQLRKSRRSETKYWAEVMENRLFGRK